MSIYQWLGIPALSITFALVFYVSLILQFRDLLLLWWRYSTFAKREIHIRLIILSILSFAALCLLHLSTTDYPHTTEFLDATMPHQLVTLGSLYILAISTAMLVAGAFVTTMEDTWKTFSPSIT